MSDFTELEAELKKLRPRGASPRLAARIEHALAEVSGRTATAGVLPKRRSFRVNWFGLAGSRGRNFGAGPGRLSINLARGKVCRNDPGAFSPPSATMSSCRQVGLRLSTIPPTKGCIFPKAPTNRSVACVHRSGETLSGAIRDERRYAFLSGLSPSFLFPASNQDEPLDFSTRPVLGRGKRTRAQTDSNQTMKTKTIAAIAAFSLLPVIGFAHRHLRRRTRQTHLSPRFHPILRRTVIVIKGRRCR
jgi:hypothetical protein